MTYLRQLLSASGRVFLGNPNALVFAIGLGVLCASVAQWSGPLAGSIAGVILMTVAAWPFVVRARRSDD